MSVNYLAEGSWSEKRRIRLIKHQHSLCRKMKSWHQKVEWLLMDKSNVSHLFKWANVRLNKTTLNWCVLFPEADLLFFLQQFLSTNLTGRVAFQECWHLVITARGRFTVLHSTCPCKIPRPTSKQLLQLLLATLLVDMADNTFQSRYLLTLLPSKCYCKKEGTPILLKAPLREMYKSPWAR